ncbi:hypothetical protein JJQ72_18705 [Paenibacillus sp. F411]|uniref:hypothetical protein n=1 Tax=Paenibacillus sp. F411 TaxID=2820239 RepID=UPI001AAFD60E|nr:hypothetical protein [Paenibacillus sp. F411]MBO2946013.1 hypothetical protein [Paenibacillus sp. F411]
MIRRKILIGSLTAVLLLSGGVTAALAETYQENDFEIQGTTWVTYSLTVPGNNINDSRGETASQVKKNSYVNAGLRVNSTGGAAIDVRTESSGPDGSWGT